MKYATCPTSIYGYVAVDRFKQYGRYLYLFLFPRYPRSYARFFEVFERFVGVKAGVANFFWVNR